MSIFQEAGIFQLLLQCLIPISHLQNLDAPLLQGIFYGFFEITIGIKEISTSSSSILTQILAIQALLSWNGLAIQAQITGMIVDSDLRITKYFLTRLLQIPISITITILIFMLPLENILAIKTATGTSSSPLLWGGLTALISIIFFLLISIKNRMPKFHIKKIMFIR